MVNKETRKNSSGNLWTIGTVLFIIVCVVGVLSGQRTQSYQGNAHVSRTKHTTTKHAEKSQLDRVALSMRLRDVMLSHPEREIYEDFHRMIESGRVGISISQLNGPDALFTAVQGSTYPVLAVDPGKVSKSC